MASAALELCGSTSETTEESREAFTLTDIGKGPRVVSASFRDSTT
jgi:hypothetical protein